MANLVQSLNPGNISINFDRVFAFADGMHVGEYEMVKDALGHFILNYFKLINQIAIQL